MDSELHKFQKTFRLQDMHRRPSANGGIADAFFELEMPSNPKDYIAICKMRYAKDDSIGRHYPDQDFHDCKVLDLAQDTWLINQLCCSPTDYHIKYVDGRLCFVFPLWDERYAAEDRRFSVKMVWIPKAVVM